MIRPPETYIVPAGSVVVPARIARLLMVKILDSYRARVRGVDPELDTILTALDLAGRRWAAQRADRGTPVAATAEPVEPSNEWFTTTQAADVLGITSRAVRKALAEKKLTGFQRGGQWWIAREELAHYRATRDHHEETT